VGDPPGTLVHTPFRHHQIPRMCLAPGAPFSTPLHTASQPNVLSRFKSPTTHRHWPPPGHQPAHQNPTANDAGPVTNAPLFTNVHRQHLHCRLLRQQRTTTPALHPTTWQRAMGLQTKFVRLYGGPWVVRTNHGGSVMHSKGLGYTRRTRNGIRPGGHANADAGCRNVSKPQEVWAGHGAYECEAVVGCDNERKVV